MKISTSTANKATFEANLLRAMDSFGYDGIDVDWEPLATTDQAQVLTFLKDLRTARPSMIITFPLNWVGSSSTPDTWLAQLAPVVDQINIMSYEMADAYPGWTSWHEAALYGETSSHPSSVSSIFIRAGVPAAKLGVGLGSYGSCWSGPTGMNQATGSGIIASDNTMTYAHILSSYYSAAAYHWDATGREAYLSWASATGPEGCTMVSYEDPTSIAEKVAYVKSAGLGGVMMWTINQGHVPTAAAGQQDPLLNAAAAVTTP
jgi:chitinase